MTKEDIFFWGTIISIILAFLAFFLAERRKLAVGLLLALLTFIAGMAGTWWTTETYGIEPPPPPQLVAKWQFVSKNEIKDLRRTTREQISTKGSSSYDQYQYLIKGEVNGQDSWRDAELPLTSGRIEFIEQDRETFMLEHQMLYCHVEGSNDDPYPCSSWDTSNYTNHYFIFGPKGFTDNLGPTTSSD